MKLAKTHKVIFTIFALVLSIMLGLCSLSFFATSAKTVGSADASATAVFENCSVEYTADGAKLIVEATDKANFRNQLVIDDALIELGAQENISKLELILTYDSYYVNGNKNAEGEFDKKIENTFDITGKTSISINVEDNVVKVDGESKADNYYKIRKVDKAIAKVAFNVTLAAGKSEGSLIIKSVNQNAGDDNYKQEFKSGEMTYAYPVVVLSEDMFVRADNGSYSMVAYEGQGYTITYKTYSVFETKSTGLKVVGNSQITASSTNKSYAHFKTENQTGSAVLSLADATENVVYRTCNVKVVKEGTDNKAPKFNVDADALEAFNAQLEKQYLKDGKVVPLGTEIEIPSMEDFVYDDYTSYKKLTKKLYYFSRGENYSAESKLAINNVGDYYFYVIFGDVEGKSMQKSDFIKFNEDGTFKEYGIYGSAKNDVQKGIFYFSIDEDVEIVINVPTQGAGYKGSRYTAAAFDITSSNCDIAYRLEYTDKAEPTEEDWVEIKKFSGVSETDDDYETLKAINYDGQYSFTPNKIGTYRITVNVTSKMSFMNAEASAIIEVAEEAKVVVPSTPSWIEENVWSVVFLSVGTLCLIGIIVLLFIKPKAKDGEE